MKWVLGKRFSQLRFRQICRNRTHEDLKRPASKRHSQNAWHQRPLLTTERVRDFVVGLCLSWPWLMFPTQARDEVDGLSCPREPRGHGVTRGPLQGRFPHRRRTCPVLQRWCRGQAHPVPRCCCGQACPMPRCRCGRTCFVPRCCCGWVCHEGVTAAGLAVPAEPIQRCPGPQFGHPPSHRLHDRPSQAAWETKWLVFHGGIMCSKNPVRTADDDLLFAAACGGGGNLVRLQVSVVN